MCKPKTFIDKCKEECNSLINHYLLANQAYENIMVLRDFQENENDLINLSVSFYSGVINTSTHTLFVEINKMYDSSPDALSIYSLLLRMKKEISQLTDNSPIIINEFRNLTDNKPNYREFSNIKELIDDSLKRIDSNIKIIKNIKTLRDSYYAHLDRKRINNIDEFFKKNKVSLLDIESLLVLNCNLCNALNSYFNDQTTMPIVYNYDDFKKTIYYLKKGIDCEDKDIFLA